MLNFSSQVIVSRSESRAIDQRGKKSLLFASKGMIQQDDIHSQGSVSDFLQ